MILYHPLTPTLSLIEKMEENASLSPKIKNALQLLNAFFLFFMPSPVGGLSIIIYELFYLFFYTYQAEFLFLYLPPWLRWVSNTFRNKYSLLARFRNT